MLAAKDGYIETVKVLIKAGANVTLRNKVSSCFLHEEHMLRLSRH